MTNSRRTITIGAVVGAVIVGVGGALLGVLVIFNSCGNTTDVNVYEICAARLFGIPISALLGACFGFCPSIFLGALLGGGITAFIEYMRRKESSEPLD